MKFIDGKYVQELDTARAGYGINFTGRISESEGNDT